MITNLKTINALRANTFQPITPFKANGNYKTINGVTKIIIF